MTIGALEFYSGIGGLHRALQASEVDCRVARAFDWDQTSCRVYEANYGPNVVKRTDISKLTASDLGVLDLDAQLWLLSPSCQPYTVLNPNAKGAHDPRAWSFLHLVQNVIPILVEKKRGPKWMLVENVAGFETSSTRDIVITSLQNCGYNTLELLLTPLQFGVPNSRLRYYLLAKEQSMSFANMGALEGGSACRNIPGHGDPWKDTREYCDVTQLREYLDSDESTDSDILCKIPGRVLLKWGRLFDIVLPSSRRSCCFTRGYTQLVERAGSILQLSEDLDTTEVFDEFLAQQRQRDTRDAVGRGSATMICSAFCRLFICDISHRLSCSAFSTLNLPQDLTTGEAKWQNLCGQMMLP